MDLDAQIESAHFVSQHHYNPQEILVYLLQFHRTQRLEHTARIGFRNRMMQKNVHFCYFPNYLK
jgi:hypothetical protein